ncbi:carbohydrate esterase family 8 protein [Exidia glandulosa HHB12029]|uniref:pectinesterase n=1 Tax=Exidia glandulosa HHB12029 TaxID=1314781 RepID=A0A165I385_EXIGL|nr:carbohydrate esterase family 8 protein [Exidia glandulosa HHB12029]
MLRVGTVFVSQTNARAHFSAIQPAVESLPHDNSHRTILIDAGTYHESLNVSRKGPTTLLGATSRSRPVDCTANRMDAVSSNLVTVFNTLFVNQSTQNPAIQDNTDSAVLLVAPNKEFGTEDFRAYNINFDNRAVHFPGGPALALSLGFSKSSFYGCTFKSWQDTVFVGKNASAYFKKSQVLGQTDYIYGFGTAFFENSTIGTRGPGCATAWKGTPDTLNTIPAFNYTNTHNKFGAYFSRSSIVRSPDADPTVDLTGQHCLGRPWNNLSRVVFEECFMDETVRPSGFTIWGPTDPRNETVTYAEFANEGPGFLPDQRISFDHILNKTDARKYTLDKVFGGNLSWIDFLY